MIKKVGCILSIIMICAISMSFVCANENITYDANVLSSDDTNTISIDDKNNEIISDSNSGNFTELSQQIQSGSRTINLDKDYKYAVGDVLNPNMTVEKNALNTKIKLGDEAIFEIIVNNTGNVELTNITIIEDKYDDGLVYLTFKSIEGTWEESLNNESKHVFTLTTPLKVGKTAKFQVIFNTTKIGEFKNTVIGNSEEDIEPITSTGVINVINNTAPDDSDNDTVPEDSDSKVKPDIIFAIENNGSNHNVDEVSNSEIVKVDDKATGNPLLVLILTLLALPIIRYKN